MFMNIYQALSWGWGILAKVCIAHITFALCSSRATGGYMSGEEMRDRQLATIKGHAEIQRLIRDNEEVAQLDPWTTIEIHQAVDRLVGIDLDLNDRELFGELLAHFNAEEAQEPAPGSALDRARQRWGLEA